MTRSTRTRATGVNVLGKIEGTDPALKDQYIVIGGHLDHLGTRGPVVMNGADDDASGPAVAMEVARVLTQGGFKPKRTIVFAAWCGEEMGLLGSNHFGNKPPAGITMDKVIANFNLDMVALGDSIGAPGALNFPEIWEKVIKRDQDPDVISAVKPSTGGPGGSDHSTFITKGIVSMALMTAGGVGHPDYHDSGDDTYKTDPEILRKTAQFVLQGTMNLANETAVQLLVPDRLYLYNSLMMRFTNINTALPGRGLEEQRLRQQGRPAGPDVRAGDRPRRHVAGVRSPDRPDHAPCWTCPPRPRPASPSRSARTRPWASGARSSAATPSSWTSTAAGVGFGRVEFAGDDGSWVVNGRLTDAGKAALKILEAERRLRPSRRSGRSPAGRLPGRGREAVPRDGRRRRPRRPEGQDRRPRRSSGAWTTIRRTSRPASPGPTRPRRRSDGATTLIAYLKTIEKANDLAAKRALYFGLIKLGWKPEDIAAFAGGSLRSLSPGAVMGRPMVP